MAKSIKQKKEMSELKKKYIEYYAKLPIQKLAADFIGFSYSDFPTSMPQQTAILGTMGFFNHLNVSFKYPKVITIDQNS